MHRHVFILTLGMGLTGCFKFGTESVATNISRMQGAKTITIQAVATEGGGVSASMSATSTSNQLLKADETSTIKGSSVTMPPGALAVNLDIKMEEAPSIATATLTSEVGINTAVTQSGTAVAVVPSQKVDAKQPFSIALPLPAASLALDDQWSNLVVMYRVNVAADNKVISGIIPRSDIVIKDGTAQILTMYFGSFQTAITTLTVTDKVQGESKAAVMTKVESAKLPALSVLARRPFLIKANSNMELVGTNFRSSMIVALGGKKVSNLQVVSDSKASFTAPKDAGFGLADVAVEQDGVNAVVNVVYVGSKSDYPVIFKAEADVCSGEKFYNENGDLKTGSRNCGALPACTQDGQINCAAVAAFPSVSLTDLSAKVLTGQTVAGITGSAPVRPADCANDGTANCVVDGTVYKAAKLANFTANNILAGTTIAGVVGTGTGGGGAPNCTSDGQTACLTTTNFPSVDKVNILQQNTGKIRASLSIAGVPGTLADCSTDGGAGCVAVAPTFRALLTSGAETKIVAGQTLATIAGTAPGKPADCTADAAINCVAVANFPAMAKSGAATKIASGQIIGGVSGTAPLRPGDCTADGASDCVALAAFPAVNKSNLMANLSKISDTLTIAGATGSLPSCTEGASGCIAIGPSFVAMVTSGAASKILTGQTVGGVNGSAPMKPLDCAADGATNCVAVAAYPAVDSSTLASKIPSGQTVAGIVGTLTGTRPADCSTDGGTNCVAVTAFPAMLFSGAAAKIGSGLTLGGVSGTGSSRPGDCAADGATNCVAVSLYPAVDKVALSSNANRIRTGTSIASITGSLADCSADGANGCVAVAAFPAMNVAGSAAKILAGQTLGGTSGSAAARPASCAADGATDCVAVASFPAIQFSTLSTNAAKIRTSVTIAGVPGTLPDCATDGGTNCVAVPSYPAALATGAAAKIVTGQTLAAISGTAMTRPGDCSADGTTGCVTVTNFPSMDKAAFSAAKLRTSQTVGGITGTLADCATDNSSGCVAVTAYPAVDKSAITSGKIKAGVSIAGITGQYPSATYPLSVGDGYTDITTSNFNTYMTSPTSFGWFDRTGARWNGAGTTSLMPANIRSGISIFGIAGSLATPAPCTTDGQTSCMTAGNFKAVDATSFSGWDLRKGLTLAGIPGELLSARNRAKLSYFNRTSGTGSNVSTTVADFYDTVDDFQGGTYTNATPSGWLDLTNPWVRDEASDTGAGGGTASNGLCDGSEDCVYRDRFTTSFWSHDSGATKSWEDAITYCENLSYGTFTDWRLPTQKELDQAYIDGLANSNLIAALNVNTSGSYWSATTSNSTSMAYAKTLTIGTTGTLAKTGLYNTICVRP